MTGIRWTRRIAVYLVLIVASFIVAEIVGREMWAIPSTPDPIRPTTPLIGLCCIGGNSLAQPTRFYGFIIKLANSTL